MDDDARLWTDAEKAEFLRRRRGRNWTLFAALAALAVLFFAISVVKMMKSHS